MEDKEIILEFIKQHRIAVLSTITPLQKSESAVLEFGETNNLEIIFDTIKTYRKYKNLKNNKNVSFVIGWDENITVQYEGEATEIFGDEQEKYKKIYFNKNPDAKRWENREGVRYFKVAPKWVRYSDLNLKPWKIIEIDF